MPKIRRVLIAYMKNCGLKKQMIKDSMTKKIVTEMEEEGRFVTDITTNNDTVTIAFDDTSKIYIRPVNAHVVGMRFTEVYIDKSTLNTPNINICNAIENMYSVTLMRINSEFYRRFDTGRVEDRLLMYELEDRKIKITKYYKGD